MFSLPSTDQHRSRQYHASTARKSNEKKRVVAATTSPTTNSSKQLTQCLLKFVVYLFHMVSYFLCYSNSFINLQLLITHSAQFHSSRGSLQQTDIDNDGGGDGNNDDDYDDQSTNRPVWQQITQQAHSIADGGAFNEHFLNVFSWKIVWLQYNKSTSGPAADGLKLAGWLVSSLVPLPRILLCTFWMKEVNKWLPEKCFIYSKASVLKLWRPAVNKRVDWVWNGIYDGVRAGGMASPIYFCGLPAFFNHIDQVCIA